MKQFCENAIALLNEVENWGETFVNLRMEFHRKHGYKLITSTWHGIDFFQNVVNSLNGEITDEPKGEYRNNFLKLIESGKREA